MFDSEYEKKWNDYLVEGTSNVLKNNFGITNYDELLLKEADICAKKLFELHVNPVEGEFDTKHLKAIHKYLFEEIYPFAGEFRNVYMGKNGSYFSPVDEIEESLKVAFIEFSEQLSKVQTKSDYNTLLVDMYIILLNIHPFREGNGRTIREFIREYANSKSKDLSIGEFEFNWSNVNIELLEESIRYARAFRSCFEIEFDKALTPVNNMKL